MSIDPPLPKRSRPSGTRPRPRSGKPVPPSPLTKENKRPYRLIGGVAAFVLLVTIPLLFMAGTPSPSPSPPPVPALTASASTKPGMQTPAVLSAVSIEPSAAFPGDRLTAVLYPEPAVLPGRIAVQWFRNEVAIDGATHLSIETGGFARNDAITVAVTQGMDSGEEHHISSLPILLRNRSPVIAADSFGKVEGGLYINAVQASDPDGDPLTFSLLEAPADMTINAESGLISWPIPVGASGDFVFQVVVSDGTSAALRRMKITLEEAP